MGTADLEPPLARQKTVSRAGIFRRQAFFSFSLMFLFAAVWMYFVGATTTVEIAAKDIAPEAGHAYIFHIENPWWPLEYQSDTEQTPDRSLLTMRERGKMLGPAHTDHDAIRSLGGGRFSHWGAYVRFSASDNSNPKSNGRAYSADLPVFVSAVVPGFALILFLIATMANRELLQATGRAAQWIGGLGPVRWTVANVLPGLFISIFLMLLVAVSGETIFRLRTSFIAGTWPIRFDEKFGFNFQPGKAVRHTNHLDYWTENRANSWGFLDREPPHNPSSSSNACEIALIGDSFVEAAQVPLPAKVQAHLDRIGEKRGRPYVDYAFGFSGTGQINQLPFYDEFARSLHPKIVVLVFVGNDFANNSAVLEALRNGWDPVHAPRLFFARNQTGAIQTQPIDPHFFGQELPTVPSTKAWQVAANAELLRVSYFYNWLYARLSLGFPVATSWLNGAPPWPQTFNLRKKEIARRWPAKYDLSGWNYPDDYDMDTMFFADHLPPVFKEALAFTDRALDEFVARAARDRFHLLILADKSMYLEGAGKNAVRNGNPLSESGAIDRLKQIAAKKAIPVIDLRAYIRSIGEDPVAASYAHDGHWSPEGHVWAAQALDGYISSHPSLCAR